METSRELAYQATDIQLAGERSTLLNDINPGYLSAKPLICKQNVFDFWIKELEKQTNIY